MQVYVEVSRNHGYTITEVIKGKFKPEIQLLIRYYNHKFRMEEKEYKKLEKEMKKQQT